LLNQTNSALLWCLTSCSAFNGSVEFSRAQSMSARSIQGRVVGENTAAIGGLLVEIWPEGGAGSAVRATVSSDGRFEATIKEEASSGWFQVVVVDASGHEIHQETVSTSLATTAPQPLTIRLPKRQTVGNSSAVVALDELQSTPDRGFRRAMRKAEHSLSRNDLAKSVAHLSRAAELEPGRVEVHTRMGVLLLQTKDFKGALEAFDRADDLAPGSETTQIGRAMSLHGLDRLHEAERQARIAVAAYPESARCRYVLGLIMAQMGLHTDGVVAHLKRAVEQYPQAYLVAAHVYSRRGEHRKAEQALRRCVESTSPQSEQHAACEQKLAAQ